MTARTMTTTFSESSTSQYANVKIGDTSLKLHFNQAGSGETIVMLHGAGAGAGGWSNFSANFSALVNAGYRVILPDCPGFNKSDSLLVTEVRSLLNARAVKALIDHLGIDKIHLVGNSLGGASSLATFGRTSDLCLLGLTRSPVADIAEIEPWLFSTGRPCLLYPDTRTEAYSMDTVAIAWDMSRSAARAVGDALPLLKGAKSVQVLVGRGEKAIESSRPAASLVTYLSAHGISAAVDEFDVSGQKIGDALLGRATRHKADMLVMGAFGHSRLREFVLGGATRRILDTSSIPLLMSH